MGKSFFCWGGPVHDLNLIWRHNFIISLYSDSYAMLYLWINSTNMNEWTADSCWTTNRSIINLLFWVLMVMVKFFDTNAKSSDVYCYWKSFLYFLRLLKVSGKSFCNPAAASLVSPGRRSPCREVEGLRNTRQSLTINNEYEFLVISQIVGL